MTAYSRRNVVKSVLAGLAALPVLAIGTRRAFAATHQVDISGFAFSPADLQVAVGDTVVFTNKDGAPHTATGDAFDTGTIKKNETATVTIAAAGAHAYKCRFHSGMKGTITAA